MSEIIDKIQSKGHWNITIKADRFDENRIPYAELDDVLTSAVVRFRGWPVPLIDQRKLVIRGEDWIGQDIDAQMVDHYEAWRWFTSGQFSQLRSVSADWRNGADAARLPRGYTSVIEVWEILFYLTEVFELAARLALSKAGDEIMVIEVELTGLEGRGLVVGQHNRSEFVAPYPAPRGPLRMISTLQRDHLVADAGAAALDMTTEILARFGWRPTRQQLSEHQRELKEYR